MAHIPYSKLLEPVSELTSAMEALIGGGFGSTTGDQRECYKRIHAGGWGLHTLLMDVITALGIENTATRPAVLQRFQDLMQPVHSSLDQLAAGFDGPLSDEQQQMVQFASAAAASIEQMMNCLWHYSLVQHRRLKHTQQPFEITALLQKLRAVLSEFDIPNLTLPARILGDETHLAFAFAEIARNTKQHAAAAQFRITAQHKAQHIAITIYDDGCGFTARHPQDAFRPFWQADHRRPGLGLGLYLAKTFIEASHGTVSIRSQPQSGTLVRVSLPAA